MNKNNKKNFLIIALLSILFFFLLLELITIYSFGPNIVNAQENNQEESPPEISPEIDYPAIPGISEPTKSLPDYIKYIYQFSIGAAGFLAMLMIVIGGTKMISAGTNPARLKDARDQILNAIIGLAIALLSYTIITIINPDITILRTPELQTLEKDEWTLENAESTGLKKQKMLGDQNFISSYDNYKTYKPTSNADKVEKCAALTFYTEQTGEEKITCALARGIEIGLLDNDVYVAVYRSDTGKILFRAKVYDVKENENEENDENDCITNLRSELYNCVDAAHLSKNINSCEGERASLIYCFEPKDQTTATNCESGGGGATPTESPNGSGGEIQPNYTHNCRCDHPLEGPPKNGFTCQNSPEPNGYCAVYQVCYDKGCYSVTGSGKCFCIDNSRYKCVKHNVTPEGIDVIETIKEGGCGSAVCSGITNYPDLPCTGGS